MEEFSETAIRRESAFAVMMAGFVVVLVLTNIIGVKLFLAFPESMPHGLFGEAITLTLTSDEAVADAVIRVDGAEVGRSDTRGVRYQRSTGSVVATWRP